MPLKNIHLIGHADQTSLSDESMRSDPRTDELVLRPWVVVFLVVCLTSTAIAFNLPVAITDSGKLAIFGSDLIIVLAICALGINTLKRRLVIKCSSKIFIVLVASFYCYCAIVFFYRAANGYLDLQSLLIPRSNLPALMLLLLIVLGLFTIRELMVSAFIFATLVAIVSLPLSLLDGYLPFEVFENQAIRTDYQLFLTPILLFGLLYRRSLKLGNAAVALFAFCLASLIFSAIVSGARVNAIFVPLLIALAIGMIHVFGHRGRRWKDVAAAVIVPVALVLILLVIMTPLAPRVQYGLERNLVYSFLVAQLFPESPSVAGSAGATPDVTPSIPVPGASPGVPGVATAPDEPERENVADEAAQSARESTASRVLVWGQAWEEFQQNIWIGTGLKQYSVTYELDRVYTSLIHPHNFAIEYLMAYGIIGFALWLTVFLFWPIWSFVFSHRGKNWRFAGAVSTLTSFGLIWGASSVQPLMLYPTVLLISCFVIGVLSRVMDSPLPRAQTLSSVSE